MVGGSIGKTQGLFGLRAEAAFFPKKYVMSSDIDHNYGLYTTEQLLSGIAIDYFGIRDAMLTFQWFADYMKGARGESKLGRNNLTNTATISLTKYMMNQRIELETFAAYRINEKAMLVDIRTSYLLKDNFKIWLGGDLFTGNNKGLIGFYAKRDRFSIGMEWGLQSKSN